MFFYHVTDVFYILKIDLEIMNFSWRERKRETHREVKPKTLIRISLCPKFISISQTFFLK